MEYKKFKVAGYLRLSQEDGDKEVSDSIFWTGTSTLSIYSDYTILNKILLEYYNTSFDPDTLLEYAKTNFNNPGIEEVDYSKIVRIILKTKKYMATSFLLLMML